ncbi:MAG TPA: hypothetical protein VHE35_20570 [Kofleriaceae bacterium]|nr:hypothetical protein [Kofleriaceae bacterium]
MRARYLLASCLALLLASACGGTEGPSGPGTGGDADGDTISDSDEGMTANRDTDHDGIPDYQDPDSDGDGIPDYREAGDTDPGTHPIDSDGDGTPDYLDLDSDDNGRTDDVDGTGDLDNDGKGDYADLDDDGDDILDVTELGDDPLHPVDTDGDGIPDFTDTDSDNDTIWDAEEGIEDYDMDGVGNWRDTDSDGDCRPDAVESGGTHPPRDTDGDMRFDFLDRDSDDDGITDQAEDTNCNGTRDGDESDATNADTDGDGVSDLIEVAAGTSATDPDDNPQANGDFVFLEPYQNPPSPMDDDLDFQTRLQNVDMYTIIDRSGSMSAEISAVRSNLGTVVRNLTCPPLGNGDPATCIPDLWAGAGTVGYTGSGADEYRNVIDVKPPPQDFTSLPINEPGGCCAEPLNFSVWSAITGMGSAGTSGCGLSGVNPRATCNGSPAQQGGYQTFGYPCFRDGALPVILLATDEQPISNGDTNPCPNWNNIVKPAMLARSAKLVGILGSGFASGTDTDLRTMATSTGAVDSTNNNAPLVFDGAGANAATAIQNGIRALANGIPLDMRATPADDPADAVDAVAAFVDHLETLQLGTAMCANGLDDHDINGDGFDEEYVDVRAGTPVCWKVVVKPNTTVPATPEPQLYRANVIVTGDGVTELDRRDVFFLVPPVPADTPIN